MIDTHTHLYASQFESDRDEVFEKIFKSGVDKLIIPACHPVDLDKINELCKKYPDAVFPAKGLHPTEFRNLKESPLTVVEKMLAYEFSKPVVAIGEIGLDYHYNMHDNELQKLVFEHQLSRAVELNLPVILHIREAWSDDTFEILDKFKGKLTGVLHCFSGGFYEAKKVMDLGLYFGIGGVVTYKSAKSVADLVKDYIPLDRILLETDSPYITPVIPKKETRSKK